LAAHPPPADLDEAIRLFAVPAEDVEPLRAAHEAVCRDARLTAWVTVVAAGLTAATGAPSQGPAMGPRPEAAPAVAAYLPVLALAAALPSTLSLHEELRVPREVTAATMADVGRMLARNRAWEGAPGLGDELAGWLTRHTHGALFQLGRLQFERVVMVTGTALLMRQAGMPGGAGDLVLNLHIPAAGGPLTPAAVDESLTSARRFFRKRFPDERYVGMVCHSWLLDPQLEAYLPPDSNLVRFLQRFRLAPAQGDDGDVSVRKFVFGDTTTPLWSLPQRTTLEEAVVRHLGSGGHWQVRSGWLPFRG
jgi:hypothetical protein